MCIVLLAMGAGVAAEDSALPADGEYRALLKHYEAASSGVARSDAERLRLVAGTFQRRNELGQEFVELAEKYPDDPVAIDALIQAVWQVNTTPWPVEIAGEAPARPRALAILQARHFDNPKLGPLCERVSFGFCQEYEEFLRVILDRSPHREVQASACLSLGHFLHNRAERIDLVREDAEMKSTFGGLYGREYVERMLGSDFGEATREVEGLFQRVETEFAGVKISGGALAEEKAQSELFAIRRLSVGCEAPEIEGTDQEGKDFKLSDYRDKVVLLDFWQEY
jgi:hypothetical protein